MAKFGKYKVADVQTGMGAFPDVPSNISQNTMPSVDNMATSQGTGMGAGGSTGKTDNLSNKSLTSEDIHKILSNGKST